MFLNRKRHQNVWNILHLLLFFVEFKTAQSKCFVLDKDAKKVSLEDLPEGVYYYSNADRLECFEVQSCWKWVVSGCSEVQCTEEYACQDAQFIDNMSVICQSYESCKGTHYYPVVHQKPNDIQKCLDGRTGNDPCSDTQHATPDPTDLHMKVLCSGPFACVADNDKNPMTVNVGSKGQVICGNLNSEEPSCRDLEIEIRHGHRACFEHSPEQDGENSTKECSVVCFNEWDCDKDTIKFVVK